MAKPSLKLVIDHTPIYQAEELAQPLTELVQGQIDQLNDDGKPDELNSSIAEITDFVAAEWPRVQDLFDGALTLEADRYEPLLTEVLEQRDQMIGQADLEEKVSATLGERADAFVQAEQDAKELPRQVRRLQYGVLGDPKFGIPRRQSGIIRAFETTVMFVFTLTVEFVMNLDLMRTGTDKVTAIVSVVVLAGLMAAAADWAGNRMRAWQTHLSAASAFYKLSRDKETFNDREVGEVSLFPYEPLFWLKFGVAHVLLVSLIASVVTIRLNIIFSQSFVNWGGMMGTVLIVFFIVAFYVYRSFLRHNVVHPRVGELREAQEDLEMSQTLVKEVKRDQDDFAKEISELVTEHKKAGAAQLTKLKASAADLKRVHSRITSLLGEFAGAKAGIIELHREAVRGFLKALSPDKGFGVDAIKTDDDSLDATLIGRLTDLPDADRFQRISDSALPDLTDLEKGLTARDLIAKLWPTILAKTQEAVKAAKLADVRRADTRISLTLKPR